MSGDLHDILKHEVTEAVEAASVAGGKLSRARMIRIIRLARLAALNDEVTRRPQRRWPIPALFVGTISVASLLWFARVGETEIELHAVVSEVRFALQEPQALFATLNLAALGASEFETVDFPAGEARSRPSLSLTALSGGPAGAERAGRITLTDLLLPAHARVQLRHGDLPRQHRLSFRADDITVDAAVKGAVRLATPDAPSRDVALVTPSAAYFRARGGRDAILDMTLLDAPIRLSPSLLVDELTTTRVDELAGLKRNVVREVSTVISGSVYLVALDDEEHHLRRAEMLDLTAPRGELRSVALGVDNIEIEFRGTVQGLTVGEGKNRRTLMPTWLEWLKARHGPPLAWGTGLYLFGLVVAVRRWWKGFP